MPRLLIDTLHVGIVAALVLTAMAGVARADGMPEEQSGGEPLMLTPLDETPAQPLMKRSASPCPTMTPEQAASADTIRCSGAWTIKEGPVAVEHGPFSTQHGVQAVRELPYQPRYAEVVTVDMGGFNGGVGGPASFGACGGGCGCGGRVLIKQGGGYNAAAAHGAVYRYGYSIATGASHIRASRR